MTPLASFYPEIVVEVPGCPLPLVDYHLVQVLADFCMKTRVLTEILPAVDVVANTQSYAVAASQTGYQLARVENAWLSGEVLDPLDLRTLDAAYPNWRTETGTPFGYASEEDGTLYLVKVPVSSITDGLQVKISYAPSTLVPPATVPDLLFLRFSSGIAAGVKARLLDIHGKEWTEHNLAAKREAQYMAAVAAGKAFADKKTITSRQRTRTYYR